MDRYGEKPKFEVKDAIGQTPFERKAAGAFFAKWCEVNDSIVPIVVDRKEWEEKTKDGILQKNEDKKHTLYLPRDLRLWEMVGIMEAVDTNTFATNPERQTEVKEKMLDLGKTFQNVGVYMAKRVGGIGEGKEIAEALAVELFDYGQSLVSGKKIKDGVTIEDLAKKPLSKKKTIAIDRFLAGDSLAEARSKKAEKTEGGHEAMRQKTINQFFRVAAKAFELKDKSALGELKENPIMLKPWQNDAPIHQTFLEKINRSLEKNIEMPKTELHASIFRRGMELLRSSMPFDSLPYYYKVMVLFWENGEKTLREGLHVEVMKSELEKLRETGDVLQISNYERRIADKIQGAISEYARNDDGDNPSKMVANQIINCVGASMLGSALMSEIGLNHLVAGVPGHSILLLVASDRNVEWRDMLRPLENAPLKDSALAGVDKKGRKLKVKDIVIFSKNPKEEGLRSAIEGEDYKAKLFWLKNDEGMSIVVFSPEQGMRQMVLNNVGNMLARNGFYNEALEAYGQAVALDPLHSYSYNGLGGVLRSLGRYSEAATMFRKAISIDPTNVYSYGNLGNLLIDSRRYTEAETVFRKAIAIDPDTSNSYYGLGLVLELFGHKEEAIKMYQKYIELADKEADIPYVKLARKFIVELEKKG